MRLFFVLLVLVSQFVILVAAEAAKFIRLGDETNGTFLTTWAFDVSDDGSVVVGSGSTAVNNKAWRWTKNGGHVPLENSSLFSHSSAVSADGSVAVGSVGSIASQEQEAFRWTESTGAVGIGDLAGGPFRSAAIDVSADGTVIVGSAYSNTGIFATGWTQATGQVSIGDLPGGINRSHAHGVSRDGSTIVGFGHTAAGPEAFKWTAGNMIGLGDLEGGKRDSLAEDVLDNGNVVVGYGHTASGREAFRWTLATGMIGLGDLAGGTHDSYAWGGSADGSLIVGRSNTEIADEAFIWDQVNGMRNLRLVAESQYKLDLTGWFLSTAFAMSADGRVIVGEGYGPDGVAETWMIRIPEPSTIAQFGIMRLLTIAHQRTRREDANE